MKFIEQNTYGFSFNYSFVEGVEEAGVETDGVGPCIAVAIANKAPAGLASSTPTISTTPLPH